uniref:Trinucleotide repeat containing adaptor 6Bb.1 n=1 Tax=Astyanax mexicanus TaxID=7994 RepID=A0A3B1JGT4_ASTMX
MEDLRNTREEQSHQELSHEVSSAPCPAPGGTAASPAGGNNAKRTTVANGQPPSGASARFMPREVPPRFRNQQEPKVLLKRGQPLVGDISLPIHTGELSNANTVHCSDSDVDPASPLSSLSSATSTYANSTWGPVSGAPSPTQGMDKAVVVDGSDLKAWPSIAEGRRQQELSAQSSSASWGQESESGLSGAGGSFSPSMMWGPSSQADAADRSFSSEVLPPAGVEEKPRDSSSTPVDWLDCKDVTVAESKSAHTVPASNDLNPMWGSGGGNVNDRGVSQGAWGEEAGGLTKKAATAWPAGGTSGNAKDSFAGSLQDSQMLATNIQTAMDNQKAGADDREGSECDSVGHGSGEDTGKLGTPKKAQATHTEVALQGMLTRNDLDPRVLCNTGWGQTQIKQGVAWDLEADSGSGWTEHAKLNANLNSANLPQKPQEGSQVRVARNQGWGDTGGGGGGGSRSDWGKGDTEWGEERGVKRGSQDDGSWGSSEEERRRGWGGKDVDAGVGQHQGWGGTQIPNNQTALKGPNQQQQQQSQAQTAQSRGPQDPRTRPNQSSGWTSGPIPHAPTAVEPSGWEEPSPQSISRKLEIDDGTAAWGDPAHYDSKSVNMWEKSGPPQQRGQTTRPAATAPTSRDKNTAPAGWDRGGPPEPAADKDTTSWGKTFDAPSGWRDSEDSGKGGGWGGSHSNSAKSGSKSMQEGWGDEGSNSSRHSSWEEEDSGPGVWGGRGPQGGSSFTAGGWNQGQGGKRICGKGPPKGNGGDSWTSPMSRQFSNMGIDEEAGGASDRPRRGMNDFNGEMRKGGRGGMTGGHGVFGGGGGIPQLRGMQQPGVHPMNPSPGIRAQVPHQFLPPQVSGSMLKPMPPPSGGMFPPQLSPQHLAMLSGIPPQMQQFQLACQLLLQQQQQQQQQQQHFLSQRKFPPPLRQQHDPQQLARIMAILQQQRQQQGVGGAKLSPSHLAGVAPKQPDGPLLHPAMGGSLADLHPKSPNTFPGVLNRRSLFWFQPGVPWKGVKSPDPDPDPDPYMTSSSMLASPALSDTDHQLLQDNTAKFTDYKSSWPPEPIGHSKSWRTNRNSSHLPRPPPGLTNQKQPSSSPWSGTGPRMPRGWGPGGRSQDSPFGTETAWSGGSSAGSSWLLLSNLTPQIDGSTLRTICLQHGPLMTFHLGLTQGSALIRYCSPHEAAKAQTALHMCVLGNTTILAEFVSEEEVAHFFTHSQSSGGAGSPEGSSVSEPAGREGERERERSGEAAAGWQGLDVSGGLTGGPAVEGPGLALFSQWSSSGAEGQGGGVWGGVTPGYHSTSLWGAPQMEDSPPGLLPGDLLGGGADTL